MLTGKVAIERKTQKRQHSQCGKWGSLPQIK